MDRRAFLRRASAAGLAVAAPGLLLGGHEARGESDRDEPYTGPLYVIVEAQGGWDVTMSFDPKGRETGINRTYSQGDVLTSGNIAYAPGVASQTAFFEQNYQDLIAINGINVATNSHPAGLRYTWTGRSDNANYPTFAALVAAIRAPGAAVPYFALGGYAANGGVVSASGLAHPSHFSKVSQYDHYDGTHNAFVDDETRALMNQTRQDQAARRGRSFSSPQSQRTRNAMFLAQHNLESIRDVESFIPPDLPGGAFEQKVALGMATYKAGACVSLNLKAGGNFDSHSDNDARQLTDLDNFFSAMQMLLDMAERFDIRDKIVLIASSDFSRTPRYNNADGKDHWSVGSMLVMAPGLSGNRVIGATDEGQFSLGLDPVTTHVSDAPDAVVLRPEHVHRCLRRYAGIDDHPYCTHRFHLRGEDLDLF